MTRLYHVIAVNESSGKITVCTATPVSHKDGCTILGKFSPHPARRMQLSEVRRIPFSDVPIGQWFYDLRGEEWAKKTGPDCAVDKWCTPAFNLQFSPSETVEMIDYSGGSRAQN